MNIPFANVSFSIGRNNHECCLSFFAAVTQSFTKTVGEDDNEQDVIEGDVEVGSVIECPVCKAQNVLNEQGEFEYFDPETCELVDVEEPTPPVATPIA